MNSDEFLIKSAVGIETFSCSVQSTSYDVSEWYEERVCTCSSPSLLKASSYDSVDIYFRSYKRKNDERKDSLYLL